MAEPWSKFFWSDYEADEGLRVCSLAAQGLWMRMLCVMARATPKGELRIAAEPCSVRDLAKIAGESEETVGALLSELRRRGVFSVTRAGVIFSRRIRKDAEISRKRAESGAKGGAASLGKSRKNEGLLKQNASKIRSKTQAPEARSQKPDKPPTPLEGDSGEGPTDPIRVPAKPNSACPERPSDVSEQVWSDFLAARKRKGADLTETALTMIRNQAQVAGWPLDDALKECCLRGWRGFKAEWVAGRDGGQTSPNAGFAGGSTEAFIRRKERWEAEQAQYALARQ